MMPMQHLCSRHPTKPSHPSPQTTGTEPMTARDVSASLAQTGAAVLSAAFVRRAQSKGACDLGGVLADGPALIIALPGGLAVLEGNTLGLSAWLPVAEPAGACIVHPR